MWDWGTWELAEGDSATKAIEEGDLHFSLDGEKLSGRFVLVRRGGKSGEDNQWLLLHKHDDAALKGWDPEEHPRSVKSGRTNDEVKDAPAATWSSTTIWAAPTPDELAALDALGKSGKWELGEHTLSLTNLDKVLFPAKKPHRALTKRDLIRHYACMAPVMLPYLEGRPVNLHRFPDGITKAGFWHKAAPSHAPEWLTRWRNKEADPGETEEYLVVDSPASLAWVANYGAIEVHPWTSRAKTPHKPTWAMIDIDPGEDTSFDDVVLVARLHRTAMEHLELKAMPKVSGQRGLADLGADRGAVHVRSDEGVGREALAHDRAVGARSRELGVGGLEAERQAAARLHPERDQQDARRAVQPAARARRARVGADHVGRARRPRSATRSLDDRHASVSGWPAQATRWRRSSD